MIFSLILIVRRCRLHRPVSRSHWEIAGKPTAALDAKWGGGFLNPERFARIIYAALKK